jgi:hypothetical protein
MAEISDFSKGFAHRVFDRMGSTGQPPERGALTVNVGTGEFLDVLRYEYLRPIKERIGNSTFKLVQAPFGGGKTQFLHCLREIAWEEGFATALVGLSPKECPFDRTELIYQEVARRLEYPPDSAESDPRQGLDAFLECVAESRIEEAGESAFRDWVREELRRVPIESRAFRRAAVMWFEAFLEDDHQEQEMLRGYLMGEDIPRDQLRKLGLNETFEGKVASRWIRSLAQLVHELGLPGTVFLFDEMDRNLSLTVRRRRAVGDNLREMIDYCGQSYLPGVVWCYAVPPQFMDEIVPEYPALAQRLKGASSFSSQAHMQPIIDLDQIPLEPAALYRGIGARLLALSGHAYGWKADQAVQERNLKELADRFDVMTMETGTRRRFVKAAATMLEAQRRAGESELGESELSQLVEQTAESLGLELEGEEIF